MATGFQCRTGDSERYYDIVTNGKRLVVDELKKRGRDALDCDLLPPPRQLPHPGGGTVNVPWTRTHEYVTLRATFRGASDGVKPWLQSDAIDDLLRQWAVTVPPGATVHACVSIDMPVVGYYLDWNDLTVHAILWNLTQNTSKLP